MASEACDPPDTSDRVSMNIWLVSTKTHSLERSSISSANHWHVAWNRARPT